MIKLIASDMDGTLLDENGRLPKDFISIFQKLRDKKVKFVVASGRPYATLYENFKPISDDLYYICDNGAYVVENGKVLNISIMDKSKVNNVIKACENIPNIELLLCGTKGAYHLPLSSKAEKEVNKYYINKIEVNNLYDIDDDIFKITICDLGHASDNSHPILHTKFKDDFMVVVSGEIWVDMMNLGVNKGSALETIQKADNISYDETMVFGDFYNDVEMLSKAYYSFVMENANDDLKKHGNFIAKKNTENGVIEAIKEYVLF